MSQEDGQRRRLILLATKYTLGTSCSCQEGYFIYCDNISAVYLSQNRFIIDEQSTLNLANLEFCRFQLDIS